MTEVIYPSTLDRPRDYSRPVEHISASLRECPICHDDQAQGSPGVYCENCGVCLTAKTTKEAIDLWNQSGVR